MDHSIFIRANDIARTLAITKKDLNDWNNAKGWYNSSLVAMGPSGNMSIASIQVDFDMLKKFVIERLEREIAELEKEFNNL